MKITVLFLVVILWFGHTCSSQNKMDTLRLQSIIQKNIDDKSVFGTVISIKQGAESWTGAAGNLQVSQPYFIASTTKLFVTAVVLKLRSEGLLQLEEPIHAYLPQEVMQGLHIYKGEDCSRLITIKHLLAQTSGLPDYFQDKSTGSKGLLAEITMGNDRYWTFEESIAMSKRMKPLFRPGTKGKAHYSDTNYQLLGKIIEQITGKDIATVFKEMVTEPLGLKNTYLYTDSNDTLPATIYYKNKPLHIPKAMASFKADGGIVSTAEESMLFITAFFEGKLFPKAYLEELYIWNKVMFPLQYGIGIMQFKLPRIFSPFKAIPAFIGHSGLSGAFMYYIPERQLYITGTVNQIHNPQRSYQLMIKLLEGIENRK